VAAARTEVSVFFCAGISQNGGDSRYNPRLSFGEMTSTYNPGVHRFSVFVACWTILLFVAGALVTSKEAALSVTDWPKSHGSWVPPLSSLQGGDFYEFSHRFLAGGLGIFTLLLAVLLLVKERRMWLRWLGLIAVLGVVAQAILGGQVVIRLLHYWLPVIHACFAEIVFAAVVGIAVFTSKWWLSEKPQLADKGSPSVHFLAVLNAAVIYLQVILGAGFRHKDIPIWPHAAGALVVLGTVTWTAVALRKRFGELRELSRARILLHAIFGAQFLLGILAYWSRLTTAEAPQPMPVMVVLTVVHTVVGAILFAFSVLVALMCYRAVARSGEVAARAPQVTTG
jgi:cytochrome c oxidase assembly protein subunit 15